MEPRGRLASKSRAAARTWSARCGTYERSSSDSYDVTEKSWTAAQLRAKLARYHRELLAAGNHRPSTITTYIQHPERFIAFLEGNYDPRQPQGRNAR